MREEINLKTKALEKMPSKKSNHEKAIKYQCEIAENPIKIYIFLDYNQKRQFQNVLFPGGIEYDIKKGIIKP